MHKSSLKLKMDTKNRQIKAMIYLTMGEIRGETTSFFDGMKKSYFCESCIKRPNMFESSDVSSGQGMKSVSSSLHPIYALR